jgi:hypothetical protein
MTNLVQQLSLWEQAVEDDYFARRDHELIRALHEQEHGPPHDPEEGHRVKPLAAQTYNQPLGLNSR